MLGYMYVCNIITKPRSLYFFWDVPLNFSPVTNIITLHTEKVWNEEYQWWEFVKPDDNPENNFLKYVGQSNGQPFLVTTDPTHIPFYQDPNIKILSSDISNADRSQVWGWLCIPVSNYMDYFKFIETFRYGFRSFRQDIQVLGSAKMRDAYASSSYYYKVRPITRFYGHVKSLDTYIYFAAEPAYYYLMYSFDPETKIVSTDSQHNGTWFLLDDNRNPISADDVDELWLITNMAPPGYVTTGYEDLTGPYTAYSEWYSLNKINCSSYVYFF